MAMEQAAMPSGEPQGEQQEQGASQLVSDVNDGMGKLMALIEPKFPEDAAKLGQIIQAYQSFIDSLGQSPDAAQPSQGPATTTPEQGAAQTQPAM